MLADQMKEHGLKKPILPTVKEIISANAQFEQALFEKTICHNGQESLKDVIVNCQKRPIGSNGGFGFSSLVDIYDISIMDSVILAFWACAISKNIIPKQSISY